MSPDSDSPALHHIPTRRSPTEMAAGPEVAAVVRIENHIDQAVNAITAHIDRRVQEQEARGDLLHGDLGHRIDQTARRQGRMLAYVVVVLAVIIAAVVVGVLLA